MFPHSEESRRSHFSAIAILILMTVAAQLRADTCPSFATAVNYSVGQNSWQVAVADFNGDGIPDAVVTNYGSDNVSVLLGTGGGAFAPAVNYPAGSPLALAVGDFNGDAKLDLAVASLAGGVLIFLGNGDGTFPKAVFYSAGILNVLGTEGIAVGDFNGDGKLDVVVTNTRRNEVAVLMGVGDGRLQPAVTYPLSRGGLYVATADLNGDGTLDLAVTGASCVSILLGKADGTFRPPVVFDIGNRSTVDIVITDIDGDGKLDLVVSCDLAVYPPASATVAVLLGNGDGTFRSPIFTPVDGYYARSPAAGDLNGDGYEDVVLTSYAISPGTSSVLVLLGLGDGTFAAPLTYSAQEPWRVALADVDGGGSLDLLVGDISSEQLSVLLNQCRVPDLALAASHTGTFTQGRAGATYTATVSNAGTVPASGTVKIVYTLPRGLTATALAGAGWNCTLAPLACTRSDALAVNAQYSPVTLTVSVASDAPPAVTTVASVSGGGESNRANSVVSDRTVIQQVADLGVTVHASAPVPFGGANFTCTIVTTNHGPGPASGIVMSATLPPLAKLVSVTPAGACSGTSTITCTVGTLASGASATNTITMTAPIAGGWLGFTATVSAAETDPDPTNNAASGNVEFQPASATPALSSTALGALILLLALVAVRRAT